MVNLWARYFHEFLFSNFSADYFEEKQYYKISKFRIRYLYLQPCDAFSIWEFSYPYSNQGEDYAHCITACPTGFENLTASLYIEVLLTNKDIFFCRAKSKLGGCIFLIFFAKPKWDWVVAFSLFLFDGLQETVQVTTYISL